jgi:N-acyl-L-homoserine lactone synthetase
MRKSNDNYGISRIDTKTTSGWEVRLQRNGTKYQRFFGDPKHGGYQRALAASKRYRDAVNRIHPRRDALTNLLEVEVTVC